jgi:SAM-dependent methyltransferase
MTVPSVFSFSRYLSSKKTVDDRALNKDVQEKFRRLASDYPSDRPLCVLELGCGIGTMVERVVERRLIGNAAYTAIDSMSSNIDEAGTRILAWADLNQYRISVNDDRSMVIQTDDRAVTVKFETADVFEFLARNETVKGYDILIANAFLDLTDPTTALEHIFSALKPGGLFYFTINFDGISIFEPEVESSLDDRIMKIYHDTMDERIMDGRPSGDSKCGRHLFGHILDAGAQILGAGSSDWVVFGSRDGYEFDEKFFLQFIINTVGLAVSEHGGIDDNTLKGWLSERNRQIEAGRLTYVAHQLDFVGCLPVQS